MLLRRMDIEPRTQIALGQICLVLGLAGLLSTLLPGDRGPLTDRGFLQGFVTGFCGVLLGVSAVLNVTGIRRLRRRD